MRSLPNLPAGPKRWLAVALVTAFPLAGAAVGAGPESATLQGLEGQQLSGQLGKVEVDCERATATGTVEWGDGTTAPAEPTYSRASVAVITFSGTHTYGEEGSYQGKVTGTVTCEGAAAPIQRPFSLTFSAQVADAPLSASGAQLNGVAGQQIASVVARVSDQNKGATAGDFTATVNWGDGSSGAGTVSGEGGGFTVFAAHTYAAPGSYPVKVVVADRGGASAVAEGQAVVAMPPPPVPSLSISSPGGGIETGHPVQFKAQVGPATVRPDRLLWYLDQRLVANCSGTTTDLETTFLSPGSHTLSVKALASQRQVATATLSLQLSGSGFGSRPPAGLHVIPSQQVFVCQRGSEDPTAQIVPESALPQPPSGCQTQVQAGLFEAVGCLTPYRDRLKIYHSTFTYKGISYQLSYLGSFNETLPGVPAAESNLLLRDINTFFEQAPCRSGIPCPQVQEAGSYYEPNKEPPHLSKAVRAEGLGSPSAYIHNAVLETPCSLGSGISKNNAPTEACLELWVATGPVVINGITYLPKPGTVVLLAPQFNIVVAGDVDEDVGNLRAKQDEKVNYRLPSTPQQPGEDFPALTAPNIGHLISSSPDPAAAKAQFGSVGGMATDLSSALHLAFSALGQAEVTFAVDLPEPLTSESGEPVEVRVHATISVSEGLVFRYGYLGAVNGKEGVSADLGPIELRNFAVCFRHTAASEDPCPELTGIPEKPSFGDDFWDASGEVQIGQARVVFRPSQEGLCTPPPPALGIGFGGGRLAFAGAELETGGIPIAPGVDFEALGVGFKDEPTYSALGGCVVFGAGGGLVKVTGNVYAVFVKGNNTYTFTGEELPGMTRPYLYTEHVGVGVGGSVELDLPVLGSTKVGEGYVLYVDKPAAVSFGAGVDVSIPFGHTYEQPPEAGIAFKAELGGAIGLSKGFPPPFVLHGELDAIVKAPGGNEVKGTLKGILADEPASGAGGIAICGSASIKALGVSLGSGTAGIGYHWGDSLSQLAGDIHIGGSCSDEWFTSFEAIKVQGQAAAANRTFTVAAGTDAFDLHLHGITAQALLRGPGATQIAVGKVAPGTVYRSGGAVVVVSSGGEGLVVIERPRPGRWRVVGVGGFAVASGRRPAIKVRLSGRGFTRLLRYTLGGPHRSAVFIERAGRDERVIGTATGGRGRIRFSIPPGRGRRQIVAAVYKGRVPSQTVTVAWVSPPRQRRLPKVRGIRLRRTKGGFTLRFRRVRGAQAYLVKVGLKDGTREQFRTTATQLAVGGIYPEVGGVVTVVAAGDGVYLANGPPRKARLRPFLRARRK